MHRDMVFHVACEPFEGSEWGNAMAHITNHGVQRSHPAFSLEANTLHLDRFADVVQQEYGDAATEHVERVVEQIHHIVAGTFQKALVRAVWHCTAGGRGDLWWRRCLGMTDPFG